MVPVLVLAALFFVIPRADSGQAPSVLHIKAFLVDAERNATPVPHHALLVSDNPTSAPPRRIVTGLDGTADLKLRPGSYTVESDRPVVFHGKAYQWTQMVSIVAGRDAVLELTADNAEVGPAGSMAATAAAPMESDPALLVLPWQASVVALWTPTTHASGFVIDAKGLIVTNQRVVGKATSVEVEVTPELKVAARVLAADAAKDVAVLWIDPKAVASARPVPLGCGQSAKPPVVDGQPIFTIGVPFRQQKDMTSGKVSRVEPQALVSDLFVGSGSAGGPVFTADGGPVGITSIVDEKAASSGTRVVPIGNACEAVAAAEKKMKDAAPPAGTPLPVEPTRPFPMDALKDAAQHRAGSLLPYTISTATFDVAFITPVMTYGAQYQLDQARKRDRSGGTRTSDAEPALMRPIMDFSNWSEYVGDSPPVLLVRVTPRLVEGFWTTVARGAAQTQGVSLPPIKRYKPGFSRLRAYCGDAEVTPIHPFTLELQRLRDRHDLRRSLRLRSRRARAAVRDRQAGAVFGERTGEGGLQGGRSQRGPADLAGLRTLSRAGPVTHDRMSLSATSPDL